MKQILTILLILPLIFSSVFAAQAALLTAHPIAEMELCGCNISADSSTNNCCLSASVLSFAAEPLNCLNETLFFARLAFVDYKSYILTAHSSPLFRPPITHILS